METVTDFIFLSSKITIKNKKHICLNYVEYRTVPMWFTMHSNIGFYKALLKSYKVDVGIRRLSNPNPVMSYEQCD